MAVEHAASEAPSANEYIVHHLSFLSNKEANGIVDFSVIHWDSVFFSVALAVLFAPAKPVPKIAKSLPGGVAFTA